MLAFLLILAALHPTQWEFRRRILVRQPGVLHVVRLDAAALRHTRTGLPDFRVAFEDRELPFAIETLAGSVRDRELKPQSIDRVKTAGGALQFTLRLAQPEQHSRIRIESRDRDFRRPVKIETSVDGKQWDVALEDGYLLDFTQNAARLQSLDVDYPASTRRFVRVTVGDWPDPSRLLSAALLYREQIPAALTVTAEIAPGWKMEGKDSVAEIDLGAQPVPWDRVRAEVPDGAFHRAAELQVSGDGKQWRGAATGFLVRAGSREGLTLHTGALRARYVRLRIYNRDDQPLRIQKLVFETPSKLVRFIPKREGEHAFWYGNAKAEAAAYDLAIVLDREAPLERVVLSPGPEKRFDEFTGPTLPWTEQHPNLFYAFLTVIAGAIAVWTIRSIKKVTGGKLG